MGTGTLRQLSGESNSHKAELNIYQSKLKGKNIIPSKKSQAHRTDYMWQYSVHIKLQT